MAHARAAYGDRGNVSFALAVAESLGLPLYEQVGKRLFLTQAGEELARSARNMVDEWSGLTQRIDAIVRSLLRYSRDDAPESGRESAVPVALDWWL